MLNSEKYKQLLMTNLSRSAPDTTSRVPTFEHHSTILLFGTVMYGHHTDQNPEEGIYSLNFEARHRTFVKQWEMAQFTIGKSVNFF